MILKLTDKYQEFLAEMFQKMPADTRIKYASVTEVDKFTPDTSCDFAYPYTEEKNNVTYFTHYHACFGEEMNVDNRHYDKSPSLKKMVEKGYLEEVT